MLVKRCRRGLCAGGIWWCILSKSGFEFSGGGSSGTMSPSPMAKTPIASLKVALSLEERVLEEPSRAYRGVSRRSALHVRSEDSILLVVERRKQGSHTVTLKFQRDKVRLHPLIGISTRFWTLSTQGPLHLVFGEYTGYWLFF